MAAKGKIADELAMSMEKLLTKVVKTIYGPSSPPMIWDSGDVQLINKIQREFLYFDDNCKKAIQHKNGSRAWFNYLRTVLLDTTNEYCDGPQYLKMNEIEFKIPAIPKTKEGLMTQQREEILSDSMVEFIDAVAGRIDDVNVRPDVVVEDIVTSIISLPDCVVASFNPTSICYTGALWERGGNCTQHDENRMDVSIVNDISTTKMNLDFIDLTEDDDDACVDNFKDSSIKLEPLIDTSVMNKTRKADRKELKMWLRERFSRSRVLQVGQKLDCLYATSAADQKLMNRVQAKVKRTIERNMKYMNVDIDQPIRDKIMLKIRSWDMEERSMSVVVNKSIRDLKRNISKLFQLQSEMYWMTANGRPIQENLTVAENHLKYGTLINLKFRLRGGMNSEEEWKKGTFQKRFWKGSLTRYANRITDDIHALNIMPTRKKYEAEYEKVVQQMTDLLTLADELGRRESAEQISQELNEIEERDSRINRLFEKLAEESLHTKGDEFEVEKKSWKRLDKLKKIQIPIFSGLVKEYESWFANFSACVDSADGTKEEKLLHLRQYLSGEPLRLIQSLGFSEGAYDGALAKLARRYGGEDREYRNIIQAIDSFPPIRKGQLSDIEELAELLDSLKIKLIAINKEEELNNGFLYQNIIRKFPEQMALDWTRWHVNQRKEKCVTSLSEWVQTEAMLLRHTREEVRGSEFEEIQRNNSRYKDKSRSKSYFVENYSCNSNSCSEKNRQSNGKEFENDYRHRCLNCKGDHFLDQCLVFRKKSLNDRLKMINNLKLCNNCLKKGHRVKECSREKMCKVRGCIKKHSYWLHDFQNRVNSVDPTEKREHIEKEISVLTRKTRDNNQTRKWLSLRTVPVILSYGTKAIEVNALLDDASTISYVSSHVMNELGLKGKTTSFPVSVIGGNDQKLTAYEVTMTLQNISKTLTRKFEALALETVVGDMKVIDWCKRKRDWPHLKDVKFPMATRRQTVDILIGADHLEMHQSLEEIKGKENEPIARLTPLGWTCVGGPAVGLPYNRQTNFARTFFTRSDSTLDVLVKQFWEVEELSETPGKLSIKEESILQKSIRDMSFRDCRYEVSIPWKMDKPGLIVNREMAQRRLDGLQKRFVKDENLKIQYQNVIEDHKEKGYIRRTSQIEEKETKWFLPHFPVIKKDRQTSKIRVVFDAAAKNSTGCLNDLIETGPKLQNDLVDILTRFRKRKIAIVSDVSEMFLQISVKKEDRKFLRFLWKEKEGISTYEFNRLVFGLNTSPYLAQLVSQENARKHQEQWPRAAEVVTRSTYMDDSLDSLDTEEEAVQLRYDLEAIWAAAGMKSRKWMSNSKKVLATIPIEEQATNLLIDDEQMITMKTLGLQWNSEQDEFQFTVKEFSADTTTKRTLLSWIARIFDPLGMLSPYVIRGKMLIQEIWMLGVDWDDPLPDAIRRKIDHWVVEVNNISKVKIPRNLIEDSKNEWSIHVFSDASSEAFGAVLYIREESQNRKRIRFVAAKSKVAPVKSVSIPRLELLGACVALKLAKKLALALEYDIKNVTFWTDSMDVLYWIRQHSRLYKPFVANRVGYIQETTDSIQWRYVNTKDNPADLLSRGISAEECVSSEMWWNGPPFLKEDKDKWPKTNLKSKDKDAEIRKIALTAVMRTGKPLYRNCFIPETFSCWNKLKRITAWVCRFINNCRKVKMRNNEELLVDELEAAEKMIIRSEQTKAFSKEINYLKLNKPIRGNGRLIKLNVFLDSEGLLRMNSRVIHAEFLPKETRYPIVLADESWLTWLVIKKYHQDRDHYAGTSHLLSDINRTFWILKAKKLIKKFEYNCLECKRKRVKGQTQIMAPLPAFRFEEPLGVFVRVAIDFAGPFETIQGRGRNRLKRYLCLFTCLQSRAVHLEVAYGLDTDACIRAILRFCSRRGKPKVILTDNGTNFVGCTKEIKGVVIDHYKMEKRLADEQIRWIFNPPQGPHFGGIFEALIKSAKKAMNAILKNADVTDEELVTVVAKAEEMINSRPLLVLNIDEKGTDVLTPNHFLRTRWIEQEESNEIEPTKKVKMTSRWKRVLELREHIWKRWMLEIVPLWSCRLKWKDQNPNIEIGEIVWIIDKKTSVGKWPLAKIIEVYPGTDEVVRVVRVRCDGKEFIRPISKIFPLDVSGVG